MGHAEASVTVDFRNIGKDEKLQRIFDDGGGGVECESSYFRLSPNHSSPTLSALLEKLQDKTPSIEKTRIGTLEHGCADEPERWFRAGGKTYLEMRSHNYKSPVTEDSEYWLIATFENGKPMRVCEASYWHQKPTIIARWDGANWFPIQPEQPSQQ